MMDDNNDESKLVYLPGATFVTTTTIKFRGKDLVLPMVYVDLSLAFVLMMIDIHGMIILDKLKGYNVSLSPDVVDQIEKIFEEENNGN